MQIKEVSKKTGLSIKTIRFYTERDLVEPKKEERNGRTYKDFSQKDLERLHMIAVLRKCLFSIEQIKTMIDHPELTPDVFSEYRNLLSRSPVCLWHHLCPEHHKGLRFPGSVYAPVRRKRELE